ncbi:MAG: UDP-N-acetylmuramoyl-L-alanine--D-glutamate ligase [Verrucomicrobia bacterium]|nr:UDP-N-acetylmuramoyl-L-alanine--D-glutamate ligase [Verrucomicrobiota bacterium]
MQKTALVIGLGVSGKAAAKFLLKQGYEVTGIDRKDVKQAPELLGVTVFTEDEFPRDQVFSLVLVSPGVSPKNPIIQNALLNGSQIMGEVELGFKHSKQQALAITGTNGKTTVTSLVEHVLNFCGKKARAIGNIGMAVTEYFLNPDPEEVLVVELSSYQLETLRHPFFDAAVLLNITPDHLDRYDSFFHYAETKTRIQNCLKEEGDLYLHEKVAEEFSSLFTKPFQILGEDNDLILEDMPAHDRSNFLAAWVLCRKMGINAEDFKRALQLFKKPSHRIEFVSQIRGVNYFDDSKGTNIDATIQAVKTMRGDVILIAGGVDKGSSYMAWKDPFLGKVKQIFVLGEAAEKIYKELSLFFNVKIVDSLEHAVEEASWAASEGDSVLLSPGCSSFDMFCDYAHRGREFQKFVALLEGRNRI